jgi:hypothetical protein
LAMGVRGMAKWGLATVLLLEVVGSGIADLSAGAASHERSQGDKALMEGKLPLALKHYEAAVRIPFPAITCQALSWEMVWACRPSRQVHPPRKSGSRSVRMVAERIVHVPTWYSAYSISWSRLCGFRWHSALLGGVGIPKLTRLQLVSVL